MNCIFRTLWSVATQSWQAVPETAKSAGKGGSASQKSASKSSASGMVSGVALGLMVSGGVSAQAPPQPAPATTQLPTGGKVAQGVATLSQTATAQAAALTVTQSSQRAVVNWDTFNLGSAARINFAQPNAQAVTLNRVNDANPSQIFGRITAPGQVVLTNAQGIYFSPTSQVDVGGLVATTHSISDDNFMAGNYRFERNGSVGKVVNDGQLNAALAGYIALLAPEVQNAGVVVAQAGTVAMATGDAITLNFAGNHTLASITTTLSTLATLVNNQHAVMATDGQIILSAVALNKLQAGVVKNSGTLEANSLVSKGGKIVLEGDDITLTRTSKIEAKGPAGGGTVLVGGDWQGSGNMRQATKVTMEAGASIDASATDKGDGGKVVLWSDVHQAGGLTQVEGRISARAAGDGAGGQIETSGHDLQVGDLQVDTQSAGSGATGQWLLDPYNITIGTTNTNTSGTAGTYTASASGGTVSYSTLQTALATSDVTVSTTGAGTDAGNMTLSWTATPFSWTSGRKLTLSADGVISCVTYCNFNIGSGGTLNMSPGSGTSIYTGTISGAGNFIKSGAGLLQFGGTMNQQYTGSTQVSAGTLELNSGRSLTNSAVTVDAGAILKYASDYSELGSLAGAGTVTTSALTGSGTNLILGGNNTSTTFSGTFAGNGTGGVLVNKYGSGTFTYTGGTSGNFYGFTLLSSAGTVQIGNGGSGEGALSNVANGIASTIGSGSNLVINRSDTFSLTNLSGPGTVKFMGGGTTIFTSDTLGGATYSSQIVAGSTLQLGNGVNAGALGSGALANAGTLAINRTGSLTLAGNISGAGNLSMTGGGTVILTGTNTYTGTTTISAGTLQVGNNTTTGTLGTGAVSNSGSLKFLRSDALTASADISGTGTIYSQGAGALTLSGILSGSGKLYQSSAGSVSLSGDNSSFTGGVNLGFGGTVILDHANAVGSTGALTFQNGTLKYSANNITDYTARFGIASSGIYKVDTGGQAVTWAGALNASNLSNVTLVKSGTGSLTLNGTNNLTGVTINAGTLQVGNGGTTGDLGGTGTVTNNGTLVFNRSDDIAISNTITGTGQLTLAGAGAVTLSGNNSYTGGTSLQAGTVIPSSSSFNGYKSLAASGTIDFAGGTLKYINANDTNDYSSRFSSAAGQAYKLDIATGLTMSFGSALTSDGGTLTKTGAGTLTLSGNNTYSGTTTISGGLLNVGSGTSGSLGSGDVVNNAQLQYRRGGIYTVANNFSGSGSFQFSGSAQTDVLTLTGNNSFGGGIKLSTGRLSLGSANAIGNSGLISFPSGILQWTGSNTTDYSARFNMSSASSPFIALDTNGQTVTLATGLTHGTGALSKYGSGTLILAADSTFTGQTTVYAGTLQLGTGGTSGAWTSGVVNLAGNLVYNRSGSYSLSVGARASSGISGTVTFMQGASSDIVTFSGGMTDAVSLVQAGPGTLMLTANNTTPSSGSTTISAGTLKVGDGGGMGPLNTGVITNDGKLTINHNNAVTINTAITGTGSLEKTSIGTLTLGGANTYSGGTTLSNGTLALNSAGALGSSGTISFGGGSLQFSANNTTDYSARLSNAANQAYKFDTNGLTVSLASALNSVGGSLNKDGFGTLILRGNNTYTGNTTITAGTLKAGSTTAFGTGAISQTTGATLDLNGQSMTNTTGNLTLNGNGISNAGALINSSTTGATYAGLVTLGSSTTITGGIGSIALSNAGTISGSTFGLTLDGAAGGSIASIIGTGTGVLIKAGAGTWTLGGANTYSGTTSINAGTLQVGTLSNATAKLGTGAITDNGNLIFYRSGAFVLSAMAPSGGAITGTGNVTLQSTDAVTVDRAITLTGANSAIYVEAGANAAANTSLVSDVTLSSTITTSATGTIAIFEGSPTATVANGSTTNLSSKMVGATGSIKYKTYNANLASLSTVVAGTRNFYYRLQPSLTITGATVSASKTYDGTTTATNAVVTGGTASSATDGDTIGFSPTGAAYDTPTAGTGKTMTVAVATTSTNAGWVVNGYSGIMSAATYAGTILQAPLTVTAKNDARFVTQTDNPSYAGVTYSGFVHGETSSDLGGALSYLRSSPSANAAGSYTLTPGGLTSINYDIRFSAGSYTIVPANQLLVRVADGTSVYGAAPSYNITSAQYVMPDNSLIDLTSQLSLAGGVYTLNDGASGTARFTLGLNSPSLSTSGTANVGTWNIGYSGATTTSPNFSNTLTMVGTQTITPRNLTVTAAAANKPYDGSTTATVTLADNRVSGDAVSVAETSATFASKNAIAGQMVTVNGITATGADIANYSLQNTSKTTTADITPKALSLSGLTAANKVYDGNLTATVSSFGALTGVVGSEDVQIDSTNASAAFATKTVGIGKPVTVSGTVLGGADIANYGLPSTLTTTADITAKALTVTGTTVANKVYDATTTATLTNGALQGVVVGDAVTLTQAGNFSDKNYSATPKTVTANDSLLGADKDNYTLTQPTGLTASISRANLSISGVSAVDRTYNATNVASLTGTPSIVPLLTDAVTVSGTPTATFNNKTFGTNKPVTVAGYTLSGTDSGNYNPVQPINLTATISKAPLSVTGVTAVDKVYDATYVATLAGTATAVALLTDNVTVTGTPVATFADKNASASAIAVGVTGYTLGGTDGVNYSVVQPTGLSALISKKPLVMTGLSAAASKTYDGNTSATVLGNASLQTALAPGAGTAVDGLPYTGDVLTVTGSPTGAYNSKDVASANAINVAGLSLTGASAGNYTLSTYLAIAATITPKDLIVKANDDANFFAVADNPAFNGVSYVGFIPNESAANLSFTSGSAPAITSSLTTGLGGQRSTPGTYAAALTPSGVTAGNYNPIYQTGDFTVVPADQLMVRVGNLSVAYGTSSPYGTPTASYYSNTYGLVPGLTVTPIGNAYAVTDVLHGVAATVTLAPVATAGQLSHSGNAVVGTYNIGASSVTNVQGGASFNTVAVTGTQTVTPQALTINATAVNKAYDGNNSASVTLASGNALIGDWLSYDKTAATFSDQNADIGKTVTVRGLSLSGSDAGNYILQNNSTTALATITPKQVQLSASKTYDGSTSLSGNQLTINTGVGSETLGYSAATLASKNVAANTINKVISVTLTDGNGGLASNYTYTTTRGADNSVSLSQANLTLAPVTDTKVYDGNKTSSQAVVVTNTSGSTDVVAAQQEFANKNVLGVGASTLQVKSGYTVVDSLNADMTGNYVITASGTANGTITVKGLTVANTSVANKVYDGTTVASLSGGNLVGVTSADTANVTLTQAGTFADKNVGTAKVVTAANTIAGSEAGNYSLTQPTALSADITAKSLTVANTSVANKVYDGTTVASLSNGSLVGVINADTANVTLTQAGTFADKNVGTAKVVTAANTIAGSEASNYSLTQPTGLSADITAKALTVANTTVANKVYDGSTLATLSSGSLVGVISSDASNVTLTQAGTFADKNVGTAKVVTATNTIAGTEASNYSLTQTTVLSADITRLASVTWVGGASGNWLDSANWAGGAVPDLSNVSNVVIPANTQVVFDTTVAGNAQVGAVRVDSVSGGTTANVTLGSLTVAGGSLTVGSGGLTVATLNQTGGSILAETLTVTQTLNQSPNTSLTVSGTTTINQTPAQIAAMTSANVAALPPSQLAAFTATQLTAIPVSLMASLSAQQLGSLSPMQLGSFTNSQLSGMTLSQVASLSGSQLSGFTPEQLVLLLKNDVTPVAPPVVLPPVVPTPTPVVPPVTTPTFTAPPATSGLTLSPAPAPAPETVSPPVPVSNAAPASIPEAVPAASPVPTAIAATPSPAVTSVSSSVQAAAVVAAAATSAVGDKGVSSAGGEGVGTVTSTSGVVVNTIRVANRQTTGVVAVLVPKGSSSSGTGMMISLPEEATTLSAVTQEAVKVSLVNGASLPSWIKYLPEQKGLVLGAVPEGGLPVQVMLMVGNQRTIVQISESQIAK